MEKNHISKVEEQYMSKMLSFNYFNWRNRYEYKEKINKFSDGI